MSKTLQHYTQLYTNLFFSIYITKTCEKKKKGYTQLYKSFTQLFFYKTLQTLENYTQLGKTTTSQVLTTLQVNTSNTNKYTNTRKKYKIYTNKQNVTTVYKLIAKLYKNYTQNCTTLYKNLKKTKFTKR